MSESPPDYTLRYFFPILTEDDRERQSAVDMVTRELKASGIAMEDGGKLFSAHQATIVRLAFESPFVEVREGFRGLMDEAVAAGKTLPKPPEASLYAPGISCDAASDEILEIFQDVFLSSGRVSSLVRMMAYHPEYLRQYLRSYRGILRSRAPLAPAWKFYIGIMASARLKSEYLIRVLQTEFLMNKGEESWLTSSSAAPKKLRALVEVNAILARQPWKLREDHLKRLRRGRGYTWSIGELAMAMVVMTHFHSLAGFVSGCGLKADDDMGIPLKEVVDTFPSSDLSTSAGQSTEDLVRVLRAGVEAESENGIPRVSSEGMAVLSATGSMTLDEISEECDRFADLRGFPYTYEDFDVHSTEYTLSRPYDFDWEMALQLLSRLSKDIAILLGLEVETIRNLTDSSIGCERGLNTLPFREAIWYYAQRLYGIEHDDYNYSRVNKLLQRPLKALVKKVVCQPEHISRGDFERMGLQLRTEERVHIILLAMEARKQAALMHGLRNLRLVM